MNPAYRIIHTVELNGSRLLVDGRCLISLEERGGESLHEKFNAFYKLGGFDYPRFFKMDPFCKAGVLCALPVLKYMKNQPRAEDSGFLLFTSSGCRMADEEHIQQFSQGMPSPAVFVYTLPNILVGEWSILSGWKGWCQCHIVQGADKNLILNAVERHYKQGNEAPLAAAWCVVEPGHVEAFLFICEKAE